MSIDLSGRSAPVKPAIVGIQVSGEHPLIKLALALPWAALMTLAAEDLKKTTAKGFWWLGRKISVRIHLAAYLLQLLYDQEQQLVKFVA